MKETHKEPVDMEETRERILKAVERELARRGIEVDDPGDDQSL